MRSCLFWKCFYKDNLGQIFLVYVKHIFRKRLQREPLTLAFAPWRYPSSGAHARSQKVPGLRMFPYAFLLRKNQDSKLKKRRNTHGASPFLCLGFDFSGLFELRSFNFFPGRSVRFMPVQPVLFLLLRTLRLHRHPAHYLP